MDSETLSELVGTTSQAGFARLKVPNTFVLPPTSLAEELTEEEVGQAPALDFGDGVVGASCKASEKLFPVSNLSHLSRHTNLLFARELGSGTQSEEGAAPAAAVPALIAAVHLSPQPSASAQPNTMAASGLQASSTSLEAVLREEASGARSSPLTQQPLVLTQDQIPSQPGHRVLQVSSDPCEVQRLGARVSSVTGQPEGGRGATIAGKGDPDGRQGSPDSHYENDFSDEDDGYSESYSADEQQRRASAGDSYSTRSPSRIGQHMGDDRPMSRPASAGSAAGPRPHSKKQPLESRIAQQMAEHPSSWNVASVCDWLEYIGLGQYRKRFIHHSVNGELLLRLTPEQLKADIGIGPLGHREGLLRAIQDMSDHYSRPGSGGSDYSAGYRGDGGEGSMYSGRRTSPSPGMSGANGRASDVRVTRALEQRQRLLKELHKAEAREGHRRTLAEGALRTLELASEEVRKLRAAIAELDKRMGWAGLQEPEMETLDINGALPWHPVGQGSRPATSPARQQQSGSPMMSRTSRKIMEGYSGTFLDRLQAGIASREAKKQMAHRLPGLPYIAGGEMAERERESKDVKYIRDLVAAKSHGMADMLSSGSPAEVEEALDDAAEMYAGDFSLDESQVIAIKRTNGIAAKAAKLANHIRSLRFMERLQHDLATREDRLKELHRQLVALESGHMAGQSDEQDAAQARDMFALLGWPEDDLEIKPEEASGPTDAYIGGLLNRVWALKRAEEARKEPDWALFKKDGLNDMQERKVAQLQAALVDQKQRLEREEAERQAAVRAGKKPNLLRARPTPPELPAAKNYLQESVQLLAKCRQDDIELLERLGGYKKMVMTFRAIRAMKFVEFTHADLQQRKVKAEQLASQIYPSNRKVLPKEQFDKFFDRLMEDTARRLHNKAEIAERARQEALAKLTKASAPAPRRRPQSAHM